MEKLESIIKPKEKQERIYVGAIKRCSLRLKKSGESFLISRFYGGNPEIKLSWAFNKEGRIKNVNLRLVYPNYTPFVPIVKIESTSQLGWLEAEALLYPLPLESNIIDCELIRVNPLYRYVKLIRYGHLTARELISEIKAKTIISMAEAERNTKSGSSDSEARQLDITELIKEKEMMKVFTSAGELFLAKAKEINLGCAPNYLLPSKVSLNYVKYRELDI